MFDAVIAAGVLPAIPALGWYLLGKTLGRELGSLSRLALMCAVGLVPWSILFLITALLGIYSTFWLGVLAWLITAGVLIALWRSRRIVFTALSKFDLLLAVMLSLAAYLYIAFAGDSILGGRDQGVYTNQAISLAKHGQLDRPFPGGIETRETVQSFAHTYGVGEFYLPGLYNTYPNITVQFSAVFPLWLAQAYSTAGHRGIFVLNGLLALLCLAVFYALCSLVVRNPYALGATVLMAFLPSQIWIARVTLSEPFAQLFVLSGLALFALSLKRENGQMAIWAGGLLGLTSLVRLDGFLLLPLLGLAQLIFRFSETYSTSVQRIWRNMYYSFIPIVLAAVAYYWYSVNWYFIDNQSYLLPIAVATAIVFSLHVLNVGKAIKFVMPIQPLFFWGVACGMVLLFIYAYWIRPNVDPYALITRPGSVLLGTRDYREDSLVNMAEYVSFPVLVFSVAGLILALRKLPKEFWLLMVVGLGYALLYFWKPHVAPDHFWAIRRYVPVVIPAIVFFAVFAFASLNDRLQGILGQLATIGAVLFLIVFLFRADKHHIFIAENRGSYGQIARLAQEIPSNALVLTPLPHIATPLLMAFDKWVVPIDYTDSKKNTAMLAWLEQHAGSEQPVYLLDQNAWGHPGLEYSLMGEYVMERTFLAPTTKPPVKNLQHVVEPVYLYKIMGVSSEPQAQLFGFRPVWGRPESGFYNPEVGFDGAFRWAGKQADIQVRVPESGHAAYIEFGLTAVVPTQLVLRLDKVILFEGEVKPGWWQKKILLPEQLAEKEAVLTIKSSTFIPKQRGMGEDNRELGVALRYVRFTSEEQASSGEPLKFTGQVSHIKKFCPEYLPVLSENSKVDLCLAVKNIGNAAWPAIRELSGPKGGVNIGIAWYNKGEVGRRIGESRATLPFTLYPGEEFLTKATLNPIGYNGKRLPAGEYEVHIGMVQEGVSWFHQHGDPVIKFFVIVK